MPDSTQAFISELLRAANEVQRLSMSERGRLLARAAATIRDYRDIIGFSEAPTNDNGSGDAAFELAAMGRTPEMLTEADVSAALLDAVGLIQAARVLLEAKREVLDEDTETVGEA